MADDYDLLVIGDAKPDVIVTGGGEIAFGKGGRLVEDALLCLGGSGGIAACGAAALGLRVAFVGSVGDDAFGRYVVDTLGAHGVDTVGVVTQPGMPTGMSVILKRGEEEAVLTAVGTVSHLVAGDIDRDLLGATRHVHLASFYLQEGLRLGLRDLFDEAHRSGASTSVDPNRDPTGDWNGGLLDLLSSTDILFANSIEVREITGVDDIDVAAEALAERGSVVAVKFGQGGGLAMWADEVVRSEAIPVDVVDTTGSGASFAAGFLSGRLQGDSLDRCLALAVACASLSMRTLGGTTALPSMEEALAALQDTA
jgi:sugar/nucleoside kinase (ribokinase family)